jgi:hypothetical protein
MLTACLSSSHTACQVPVRFCNLWDPMLFSRVDEYPRDERLPSAGRASLLSGAFQKSGASPPSAPLIFCPKLLAIVRLSRYFPAERNSPATAPIRLCVAASE